MNELVQIKESNYTVKKYVVDKHIATVTYKNNIIQHMNVSRPLKKEFSLDIDFRGGYHSKMKMMYYKKMNQDQIKKLIEDYECTINIIKKFVDEQSMSYGAQ